MAGCAVLALVAGRVAHAQRADSLPRPALEATYRTAPIIIDGRLDEADWSRSVPASNFSQVTPTPGAPASYRTEAHALYDRGALYVGVRMLDSFPDSIARQLARRDATDIYSDWLHVAIDSYFDRRTAFRFSVTPAGVQSDAFLFNDVEADPLWDAVWASATSIDSSGWSAELRIPLSQIRFSLPKDGTSPRWGFNVARTIARTGEDSRWSPTPPAQPGIVSRYGDLVGLDSLTAPRRLEVIPYVSSRLTRAPGDRSNPFYDPSEGSARIGADVRYGLPRGLTLTATISPDFGQVEVDPAVVNLSAFEVFFPERRPFFLEGVDIFRFGGTVTFNDNNPSNFFYTRRIGRAPRRSPASLGAEFVDVPLQTEITAAAKISGKTNGGLSLGVLGASTREETGRYTLPLGERRSLVAEPRTDFLVARARQDFRRGNTVIGGVLTGVRRDLRDPVLRSLFVRDAVVSGADFEHRWGNRSWALSGSLSGSRVAGDRPVISALQRAPIRLFQRPDAGHLTLDSSRTYLSGYFGTISLARTAGQHWLGSATYEVTTPGFEVNDLGFQTRSDFRSFSTATTYRETTQGRLLRNYQIELYTTNAFNLAGDVVERRASLLSSGLLNNFWGYRLFAYVMPRSSDDRLTRGGPIADKPGELQMSATVRSDSRRPAIGTFGYTWRRSESGEWYHQVTAGAEWRPSSAARLRLSPQYTRVLNLDQYVTAVADPLAAATFGRRYVFGDMEQHEASVEARAEWTFSPSLTLQLWAQPFVSSGRIARYKEFRTPGTFDFDVYGAGTGTIRRDRLTREVLVDPDGPGSAPRFTFEEQDYLVRSLRGNAVFRWEYRPGSTLFLVWQQQREGFEAVADLTAVRDVASVFGDRARNVFLVKMSYWMGR